MATNNTRTTHLLDLAVLLILSKKAKLLDVLHDPETPGRHRYRFVIELLTDDAATLYDGWTCHRDPASEAIRIPLPVVSRLSLGSRVAIQWLMSGTSHPHREVVPEVWEAFTRVPRPPTA
jgi:hypothetical protein